MKPKNDISTINLKTKAGNTLSVFFNAYTGLLAVDLVHANEKGGSELVRMTLNEKQSLAHCEPAIDVAAAKVVEFANQTLKTKRVSAKRDIRTPAQWCEKFGVQVIDPDGWDRTDPHCMDYPITQDQFIEKYQRSTAGVVDREKFLLYKHLFG